MSHFPSDLADTVIECCRQNTDIEAALVDDESGVWALQFEDGLEMFLSWHEATSRLTLEVPLGVPGQGDPCATYHAALLYNAAWRATGGARVSSLDTQGTLALSIDLDAHACARQPLQFAIEQTAGAGREWIGFVAAPHSVDPVPSSEPRMLVLHA